MSKLISDLIATAAFSYRMFISSNLYHRHIHCKNNRTCAVSMDAVYFHTTSSKDRKSSLEVVSKNEVHSLKLQYSFAAYKDKLFSLYLLHEMC